MALMRCPKCRQIVGDYPDVTATEDDGTAVDEFNCYDCVVALTDDSYD
jgi:hypothetical protein